MSGRREEEEARDQRRKTIRQAADDFLVEYKAKHESATFVAYALGHVTDHFGGKLVLEITPTVVKRYQTDRLVSWDAAYKCAKLILLPRSWRS
jgi:hypothetical protein